MLCLHTYVGTTSIIPAPYVWTRGHGSRQCTWKKCNPFPVPIRTVRAHAHVLWVQRYTYSKTQFFPTFSRASHQDFCSGFLHWCKTDSAKNAFHRYHFLFCTDELFTGRTYYEEKITISRFIFWREIISPLIFDAAGGFRTNFKNGCTYCIRFKSHLKFRV